MGLLEEVLVLVGEVVALGVIAGLISLEFEVIWAEHDLSYSLAPFRVNLNTSKILIVLKLSFMNIYFPF